MAASEKQIQIVLSAKDRASSVAKKVSVATSGIGPAAKKAFDVAAKGAKMAKAAMDKAANAVKGVWSGLKKLALAATAGLVAFTAFVVKIAAGVDDLAKMSRFLDINIKQMSLMKYAAERSGFALSDVVTALRTATKQAGQFGMGSKAAVDAFHDLGMMPDGKAPVELITEIATSLGKMTDKTKKLELAQVLLGRAGFKIIELFKENGKELRALTADAVKFGAIVDSDLAQKGEALTDAWLNFKTGFLKVGREILRTTGETVGAMLNKMGEWFSRNSVSVGEFFGLVGEKIQIFSELIVAIFKTGNLFGNIVKTLKIALDVALALIAELGPTFAKAAYKLGTAIGGGIIRGIFGATKRGIAEDIAKRRDVRGFSISRLTGPLGDMVEMMGLTDEEKRNIELAAEKIDELKTLTQVVFSTGPVQYELDPAKRAQNAKAAEARKQHILDLKESIDFLTGGAVAGADFSFIPASVELAATTAFEAGKEALKKLKKENEGEITELWTALLFGRAAVEGGAGGTYAGPGPDVSTMPGFVPSGAGDVALAATQQQAQKLAKNMQHVARVVLNMFAGTAMPAAAEATENLIVKVKDLSGLLVEIPEKQLVSFADGFADTANAAAESFGNIVNIGRDTANALQNAFSQNFLKAMQGEFKSFGDFVTAIFRSLAASIMSILSDIMASQIVKGIGSLFTGGGGIQSNPDGGKIIGIPEELASGGIVNGATFFGSRGGFGVAGEAGPEGVLPLKRDANGDLGVISSGGGGTVVNFNVTAVDAASVAELFRRNGKQMADALASAVSRSSDSRATLRGALS